MSTRNWPAAPVWAFVLLFSSLQVAAQKMENLQVDDGRPIAEALKILENRTGIAITYEDPEYQYAADIKDVTALVRRSGESEPRIIVPAGGVLDFSYPLAADGKPQEDLLELVNRLLHQDATGVGKPTFSVQRNENRLNVVPASVRNKAGELVSVTPLLDQRIYIPNQQLTGYELLSLICSELTHISGHRVYVATVPVNPLQMYRSQMGANNERARDVLSSLLDHFAAPLSWQFLYDPGFGWYALNIHAVPPFHSSQRSGPVAVHPGPPPPPLNLHGRQRRVTSQQPQ